jgi:alpha-beta hydrolase superfamily lysophospholipase
MIRTVWKSTKHALKVLSHGVLGGFVILVAFFVMHLNGRPDLSLWHTARLDEEFRADSPVKSFGDYLALENRLFEQLDQQVYDQLEPVDRRAVSRYSRGSLSDPGRWPRNWNRSFELAVPAPRAGALLIHGMSDSPYSMRSLAQTLHGAGAHVIGLRVPGHGTAPSGLVDVQWQDMAAAVRLAVAHLREEIGDRPLVIVGYSNGGALTVEYSLEALEDDRLPLPDQIVLLSPEIGITKLAALAVWQERLGHVLGLSKLSWNSILPEYDPFKYGSFALNAGKQAYLITQEIQQRLDRLSTGAGLERFPPLLAFQSVVDATVSAPTLVTGLLDRLPVGGHELVLFDINRRGDIEPILKRDERQWLDAILRQVDHSFTIGVVVNESKEADTVVLKHRRQGETEIRTSALGLRWPDEVYSLSHVALPFPPDDPVYGGPDAGESPGIQLGKIALRGERGVLEIGAADMLRLRWNPFHEYIERRLLTIVGDLATAQP